MFKSVSRLDVPPRIRKSSTATIIYSMMPVSQKGLKDRLGAHKDAVWRALKLLKEHELIYITGYESDNTTLYTIFAAGKGLDAARPSAEQLAKDRASRYKNRNAEAVRKKDQAYKEKNRALLAEKSKARYAANKDMMNAIARAKRSAAKEKKLNPIVTQWQKVSPWPTNMELQ